MKDKILKVLSYILVAALASAVSCGLMVKEVAKQSTKLNQLSRLIEERFIGEADMTRAEDAAAAAMVDSLGDKWSYYLTAEEYVKYAKAKGCRDDLSVIVIKIE